MPAAVGLIVLALAVLVFSLSRAFQSGGESGNPTTLVKEIQSQAPANAPGLPRGFNPTEGVATRGGAGKKH